MVEGFLALFCGGSLGGPSAAFCGYASWLAWWWISGASMDISSSLLSISGLEAWCYETHRFASRCLARIRGAPFEGSVRSMFGGGLYVLVLELEDALGELVLWRFPSARVDVRGRISRRLLNVFFLRSCLRGMRWWRRFWRRWIVRRRTKWCRRRSMLFFVVGFWWGLWGLWLALVAACFLRLSRWGSSAWM